MSVYEEVASIIEARSLAVVGASSKPGKFGNFFVRSQLSIGFDGDLYMVNPNEEEILGMRSYPSVRSLPRPPDLVYVTIPAARSLEVLRDCAAAGVKGVVMIASGFRESGAEGLELEQEALKIARSGGFRIVGPNCFGIYNPATGLTMLPGRDFSRRCGHIGFISQSGGFSAHLVRQAQSLGLRVSAAVSYGNAADLDEADLLEYFARDEKTSIIAGYLEGVRRGPEFKESLGLAASKKDVVLWKVGVSESSRRAVLSHTGSLAGSKDVWEALMRQCGVIEACGVDEVIDVVLALEHLGRRPGRRLMLVGGGGGLGTYASDIAESLGLEVPPLEQDVEQKLSSALGRAGAVVGNPLDFGAPMIPLDEFRAGIEAAASADTDVLVFDMAVNFASDIVTLDGVKEAVRMFADAATSSGRKTAAVLYNRSFDPGQTASEEFLRETRAYLHGRGIPVFPSIERALKAIALVNS